MQEDWLTTQEAAELSGYHEEYIRRMVRAGKLEARKFGPVWQVNRANLLTYLEAANESDDPRRGPQD